jgi:hypothetical protein
MSVLYRALDKRAALQRINDQAVYEGVRDTRHRGEAL